jgi:hypothetical protein
MAIRRSTGLRNGFAGGFGLRELLRDGKLLVYSGSQPSSADDAPAGTLLVTYTLSGGAFTPPVRSAAKFTIAGGSGSIDTVKVGGMTFNLLSAAVPYNASTTQTATDVAANINARQNPLNIVADTSGSDVRLYLPYWLGALGDTLSLAVTATTLTAQINGGSSTAFGGPGAPNAGTTAVNGLNFLFPAVAGALSKEATIWQGTAVETGTAGWFRFVAGGSSESGSSTTDIRFDGNVGTSGADLNLSSTAITSGAVQSISGFTLTIPIS